MVALQREIDLLKDLQHENIVQNLGNYVLLFIFIQCHHNKKMGAEAQTNNDDNDIM